MIGTPLMTTAHKSWKIEPILTPQWQTVSFPVKSLTMASELWWQTQPLSKALPVAKSPVTSVDEWPKFDVLCDVFMNIPEM